MPDTKGTKQGQPRQWAPRSSSAPPEKKGKTLKIVVPAVVGATALSGAAFYALRKAKKSVPSLAPADEPGPQFFKNKHWEPIILNAAGHVHKKTRQPYFTKAPSDASNANVRRLKREYGEVATKPLWTFSQTSKSRVPVKKTNVTSRELVVYTPPSFTPSDESVVSKVVQRATSRVIQKNKNVQTPFAIQLVNATKDAPAQVFARTVVDATHAMKAVDVRRQRAKSKKRMQKTNVVLERMSPRTNSQRNANRMADILFKRGFAS
jgi:hypothetical protein